MLRVKDIESYRYNISKNEQTGIKKRLVFLMTKHQSYLIKKIPLSAFNFQFIQNSTHLFKCCDTSRYKRQTQFVFNQPHYIQHSLHPGRIAKRVIRLNSRGNALPITEITPTAPKVIKGNVIPSSPEITSKLAGLFLMISSI